jgi:hypothetical protein
MTNTIASIRHASSTSWGHSRHRVFGCFVWLPQTKESLIRSGITIFLTAIDIGPPQEKHLVHKQEIFKKVFVPVGVITGEMSIWEFQQIYA